MTRASFAVALIALACACNSCTPLTPPVPDPVRPPTPVDPAPPGANPCERAEAHSRALGCSTSADTAVFVDTCQRYESLGGESSWHPEPCMVSAASCAELEACRGGQ